MTAAEVRQTFLDFFKSKGHTIVPSAPIVVKNDPTLMFTNAGMNQFKDIFLGNEPAKYKRVADTQKCLRVSGKHNDLEEVGVDTYHHTMFEMLGNWSFGDYFKKEAIEWAWELLTEVYILEKDRLYVTVFEGDEKEGLAFDTDAFNEWKKYVAEDRILRGNKKDNFWEMGDTGPCGPCSEIHIDLRSNDERKKVAGATLVNNDHPQVIEIWNNVFMEFNRKADGSLEKLPAQHVDTGMGFERLVRAIECKTSNYDTDVFVPTIKFIEQHSKINYAFSDSKTDIAMRVMADHIRAICFAIADGQLPSNNGAGYVIRRILRRAVRYQYQFLNIKEPFLCKLAEIIAESFKNVFPELHSQKDFVVKVIREEEISFLRTVEKGLINLHVAIEYVDPAPTFEESGQKIENHFVQVVNGKKVLTGRFCFDLYDRDGFPFDLTKLIAGENDIEVDEKGFEEELQKQKARSRKATEITTDDWIVIGEEAPTTFLGYDVLASDIKIIKYRKVKAKGKEQFQLVFNQTPFYPEGGGQVGDNGFISNVNEKINIINTQKENNLIIHFAEKLPENVEANFTATVDLQKRTLTESNHSATHLLHAALRSVLGNHVQQKGSLVNDEYLRFDFSHFAAMTDEEIAKVEHIVNAKVRENISLDERRSVPIEEAKTLGAMMLFGEKYGESVRVITFSARTSEGVQSDGDEIYSRELCGGTHVKATGQIGLFKITSEAAVAAGVRRIEAITADASEKYVDGLQFTVDSLKEILKSKDLVKSVEQLVEEKNELLKKLEIFENEKTVQVKQTLKSKIVNLKSINTLIELVEISSADQLKNLSFQLKNETENLFCVLGCVLNNKPFLSVIISENLVTDKKLDAGKIVKELAKEIQGGGGGQAFYATAGGNKVDGLNAALEKAKMNI
ncbi:MAG: alanine--tRNA ligase [Bacteroidota bacterium]